MNTHPSFREVRESDQQVFPIAWYAVGWSKELKNKPLKKRLLGKDIVLYRDDHRQVHAIHAYCPHRGADLSLGYCQNGHITCPYHAWSFDESGQCVDIPAHPGRAIPEFAHTYAYPVIEKAGLLWVYPQAVGSKSEINSGLGTSTSPSSGDFSRAGGPLSHFVSLRFRVEGTSDESCGERAGCRSFANCP